MQNHSYEHYPPREKLIRAVSKHLFWRLGPKWKTFWDQATFKHLQLILKSLTTHFLKNEQKYSPQIGPVSTNFKFTSWERIKLKKKIYTAQWKEVSTSTPPSQGHRKVWKSGGASSNMVGIICPPGWERVNWSTKIWGVPWPPPLPRLRQPCIYSHIGDDKFSKWATTAQFLSCVVSGAQCHT